MAYYDFDYAIQILHHAIDFAVIEHDFITLRKWVNEVEQSGHRLEAIETRLNFSNGQVVLMAILQSVASGTVTLEEALLCIRLWLNNGQLQAIETKLTKQYQFV